MDSAASSNLVEFTFQSLYRCLSAQQGVDPEVLRASLRLRIPKLRDCTDPFGKPSVASRSAVRSGSVKLADGITLKVEGYQQDLVYKISEKFQLDEIESLIILRSFFYNEGYEYSIRKDADDAPSEEALEKDLLASITEFYFDERLFLLRTFLPLYRAQADEEHPYHDLAAEILTQVAPDPTKLVSTLVSQILRRSKQELPPDVTGLVNRSKLAKQIVREQLCMLEVIFWATYNLRCPGSLVAEFYEIVYSTSLGATQANADLLLDPESTQLLLDLQSVFILTAVQVLSIEVLYKDIDLEIVSLPRHGYFAQPQELERIHKLVYSTPTQPRFSPIVLAWACVIRRIVSATESDTYPQEYVPLLALLAPEKSQISHQSARDSVWQEFTKVVLNPAMDLFGTLRGLLLSPILNTEAAAKVGSSITNPNDNVVRAILKGVVIGLTELIRLEYIEEFDSFLEVWVLLFGSGEYSAVAPLCAEFWEFDLDHEPSNRRALLEITRDRFPVQARPLIRVLRSLSAAGGFNGLEGYVNERELDRNRGGSAFAVYQYLDTLPSFTQVIPTDNPSAKSLYDVRTTAAGSFYSNIRPLRLPGGSILPARSSGHVISDAGPGSPVVVMWQHQHSGWRIVLGLLKDFVKKRQVDAGGRFDRLVHGPSATSLSVAPAAAAPVPLTFEDIGVEEGSDDQELITDLLDLLRAVLRNNNKLTPVLMESMLPGDEIGDLSGWQRASLIEVIPLILQDALHTTSTGVGPAPTRLVTNILGVMTTLLPHHPGSLWSSLRNSALLFGDAKHKGSTPVLLAFERVSGTYAMTLALLDLVRALFDEAQRKMYTIPANFRRLKTELLMRALAFLHNEVWIEYSSWKYVNLGEKFQIGAKITSLFVEILNHAPTIPLEGDPPPQVADDPLSTLSTLARFVLDAFFLRATVSTINPLVSIVATGHKIRQALHKARRFDDAHHLDEHIQISLRLCRLVLVRKSTTSATRASLLEQGLFMGISAGTLSLDPRRLRLNPVDTIATSYVRPPNDPSVQLEAVKLLTALCISVSTCQPSPPSIVGHLSAPDEVVQFFLSVVQHADDEPTIRLSMWHFICAAVDTQPALASLFLSGKGGMETLGRQPTKKVSFDDTEPKEGARSTAIDAATSMLHMWKTLWDENPALLASSIAFLDLVWQHAAEHTAALQPLRKNDILWSSLADIINEGLGSPPDTNVTDMMDMDGQIRSGLHEPVSHHAYKTLAKAHAVHLLALDTTVSSTKATGKITTSTKSSTSVLKDLFTSPDRLKMVMEEAITNPANPELHSVTTQVLEDLFPLFSLESVRAVTLPMDRTFGDDYLFPSALVDDHLHQYADDDITLDDQAPIVKKKVISLNLDWSLTDAHIGLTRSWKTLLQTTASVLRGMPEVQPNLLKAAKQLAEGIAKEDRSGEIMGAVHAERLEVLLTVLDASWAYKPTLNEILALLPFLRLIISSETFRPLESAGRLISCPFHQSLLQIIFYAASKSRSTLPEKPTAAQRASIGAFLSTALHFAIDSLRVVFEMAREANEDTLDRDMELFVAVFEECIRPGLSSGQSVWLSQLQEANLIRSSLELFSRTDIGGLLSPEVLRYRRYPFYTRHILQFHLALANLPASAERLAHEGAMAAYSANTLTALLEAGGVDVTHVAHHSWCTIVAIVTNLILVLGTSGGHFVNAEIVGFVQLYGVQLTRVLSWKIDDPFTFALMQEMEAVLAFFHAITTSSAARLDTDDAARNVLLAYSEKVLYLLQQLNAGVSYPNQLAGALEPLTAEEQTVLEKEAATGRVDDSAVELLSKGSRPILASVVQKFAFFASTILTTLVIISGGDKILSRVPPNSLGMPLISPNAKVAPNEPATLGTLIELGNWSVDVLVHLLKHPTASGTSTTNPLPHAISLTPFDAKLMMTAAGRIVESLMVYASTQLSLWMDKARLDGVSAADVALGGGNDGDGDYSLGATGRRRRMSIPLGGMHSTVNDQALDLNILASRAKDVLGKLTKEDEGSALILLEVLIGFGSAKLMKTSTRR